MRYVSEVSAIRCARPSRARSAAILPLFPARRRSRKCSVRNRVRRKQANRNQANGVVALLTPPFQGGFVLELDKSPEIGKPSPRLPHAPAVPPGKPIGADWSSSTPQ